MNLNRRQFLKVLGVTSAAATVEGCTRGGHEHVIPYLTPREDIVPGVNVDFATVCRECPAGCGMIARVRDGRCIKVEGNPLHPVNRGALCLRGQSSLQGLYNPDRFRGPMARDANGRLAPISWDEAQRRLQQALFTARGGRAVWIGRLETGPMDTLIDRWLAAVAPNHTRLTYEPFSYGPLRAASARVLGRDEVPLFQIAAARMLVSFGADFLETWVSNVEYGREFGAWRVARREGRHSGRYVFIGPRLSLTGANADEWIPIRPGTEALAARALEAAVSGGDPTPLAEQAGIHPDTVRRLAREFTMAGPSLALPVGEGGTTADATAANEAILRLNRAAGNVGKTVIPGQPHALSTVDRNAAVMDAVRSMATAPPAVVFIYHTNPLYNLPAKVAADAFKGVREVVSFSSYPDETTAQATLVLPDNTPLESWGEYTPRPGITGVMQPAVSPVFDTRQTGDVLLSTAARMGHDLGAAAFHDLLERGHGGAGDAWNAVLQRGCIFAAGLAAAAAPPPGPAAPGASAVPPAPETAPATPATSPEAPAGPLYLHVYPSAYRYDGRLANRPWAQEIPDPVSKVVWGSWVEIHPSQARRLKVGMGDVLTLTTEYGKLQVPAYVSEHVHPQTVALQVGQGHVDFGRYASGVGVNAYQLLGPATDQDSGALVTSGIPVTVARVPVNRPLVILQTGMRQMQYTVARGITLAGLVRLRREAATPVPESPGAKTRTGPASAPPGTPRNEYGGPDTEAPGVEGLTPGEAEKEVQRERASLYAMRPEMIPGVRPEEHWGMAIDLDSCIGCNACVAACYAENNVPIVGKDQCGRGREMSWLRIENYQGDTVRNADDILRPGGEGLIPLQKRVRRAAAPGEPAIGEPLDIRFLPMLCQQCDNAPCEYVCPVDATMHSTDHLNEMVYNRCVGTRYCSNNCPYKVRRFNWFEWKWPEPLNMQLNPDVTRRSKGVMEKCTFCVQRIRRARIDARAEKRPIREGEIVTACQQACPTNAIVFGNLKDPNSEVSRLAKDPRGYGALSELNTYPNINYLARVRAE